MQSNHGMSEQKLSFLTKRCEDFVEENKAQGIVVQIQRHNQTVYHKAFGKSHYTPDSPDMKLDTIFPLVSITKPVTAACFMILQEEGRVDVGERLDKFFPEFKGKYKNQVTISTLLTHTSGFDENLLYETFENYKMSGNPESSSGTDLWSEDEFLHFALAQPLGYRPDTNMIYANINYNLAAKIVEMVSGETIDAYAQKRIFTPLGMNDTYYVIPKEVYPRVMTREGRDGRPHWVNTQKQYDKVDGATAIYSTTSDILKFMSIFMNKGKSADGVAILSPVTVKRMIRNQIPGISAVYEEEVIRDASWGYGWSVRGSRIDSEGMLHSDSACCHGGYENLFVDFDPEYDLMYAAFTINHIPLRAYLNNLIYAAIEEE